MVEPEMGYRLVYDGVRLVEFFGSEGYTLTINTLEEFDTCEEMFTRMGVLGLPTTQSELEAWLVSEKGSVSASDDLTQRLSELSYVLTG